MPTKPLTAQQRQAAAYVAIGHTDQEIADTLGGVAKSTVTTWRKRTDFQQEVNRCVSESQRMILRRSVANAAKADAFLLSVIESDDPTISWPAKIQAASKLAGRLSAASPEHLAEPVPDAPRQVEAKQYTDADGNVIAAPDPEQMLLEMYKEMAKIEEARSRSAIAARTHSGGEDDEDEDEDHDPRIIVGELAEDDDESGAEPEPLPAPIREVRHRPVRQEPVEQREVEKMLRNRDRSRGWIAGQPKPI